MRRRSALRAAVILAGFGATATACTSGGSNGQGIGGGNKTLHLALNTAPTSFKIGQWAGGEQYLATAVYDTILTLAASNDRIEPGIAKSWEYNSDRTQLTLHIREGMKFSDGTSLDAAAVVASLEALRTGSASSSYLSSVAAVQASDPTTVLVTLSRPDGALLFNLCTATGAVGSPRVLTADSSNLEPVGSGPYVLDKGATKVGDLYVLVRNKDHWNAAAYPFERVEAKLLEDTSAQQNAFRAGQIDVLGAGVSKETLPQYPTSQFSNGRTPAGNIAALWLVDREGKIIPALADQRVRQAINMAFDRTSIVKNLAKSDDGVTNQIFSPASDAFDEALLDKTPHDVAAARDLMAEAGYADGFSVTMPSNFATSTYESVVSQSLSDIGVTVTWEPVPFQDFWAKVFGASYGMFFMFNNLSGIDAKDADAALNGAFNPFQTSTPELQQLLSAANSAPEGQEAKAFGALNEYLVDQAWFAPLSAPRGFYVASKAIASVPASGVPGYNLLGYSPAT
jgi:peptide/nickel transport system substrate-binding protein